MVGTFFLLANKTIIAYTSQMFHANDILHVTRNEVNLKKYYVKILTLRIFTRILSD